MYEPMINIRISVVIPTRDRCTTVVRCLASLREQTMNDYEIIVVNGGTTDKTKEELDQLAIQTTPFRQKLIHHRLPRGANPSRNAAIKMCFGAIRAVVSGLSLARCFFNYGFWL